MRIALLWALIAPAVLSLICCTVLEMHPIAALLLGVLIALAVFDRLVRWALADMGSPL